LTHAVRDLDENRTVDTHAVIEDVLLTVQLVVQ
jgi:hypothetical protein